jgi:hypothetical protein
MQTIALTTSPQVEIISAYATTNQTLPAVSASPGWYVLGAFFMPVTHDVRLETIGVVSHAGLTLRVRLFDLTEAKPISGTLVELTELVDTRRRSGLVNLKGNRAYQVQAECIGGGPSGFAVVKTATLV